MQYMQQYRLNDEERAEKQRQREEREAAIRLRNNRLGVTVFQISWIMIFICLVVVNWQMGFSPGWRPEGLEKPDGLLPAVATIALLASTWLARGAWRAVTQDRLQGFLNQWRGAILMGVVFLAIMMSQFFAIEPGPDGQQFGYMYRLMIGYHALHALVIGYLMVQVYRRGRHSHYHAGNSWAVEGTTKLWYFVTVAWILFYIVLYWI